MGLSVLARVWDLHLPPALKITIIKLADSAPCDGPFTIDLDSLAAFTGLGTIRAAEAVENLRERGLLTKRATHVYSFPTWLVFPDGVPETEPRRRDRGSGISPHKRWKVYSRDNFRCRHCGSEENLTIDHIKPRSLGGSHSEENLQTLCGPCNGKKGARYDATMEPAR